MYALESQQQIPSDDVPLRSVWVGVSHTNARMSGRSERDINFATQGHTRIPSKLKIKSEVGEPMYEREITYPRPC